MSLLARSLERESLIAGVYTSQTSAIYFRLGCSCCPYYRGVHYIGLSASRERTVFLIELELGMLVFNERGKLW